MSSTVYAIVFDCQDAGKLTGFWAQALGRTVDSDATHDYATIGHDNPEPGQPRLSFIKVPEGKTVKNRVHLDLMSADLDGEVQRLVTLGATQGAKFNEGGARWITLTDPEGNAAEGVNDEAWMNAAKHYDDDQLVALVSVIALINAYNRMNVIIRQPAGDYQPGQFG